MKLGAVLCLLAAGVVAVVTILQPEACIGDPVLTCKPAEDPDPFYWGIGVLLFLAAVLFAISRRRSSH